MEVDSMNKKIKVWGREFSLKIIFEEYDGENVLEGQKKALDSFLDKSDDILSSCDELKKYCIEKNGKNIGEAIDNIFKYVIPQSIFVKRDDENHIVDLLCNYKFDEEHGISLFFKNEKLDHIGSQDDI